MKYSLIVLLFLSWSALGQNGSITPRTFKMDSITVKQYYFVMLVKGPKRSQITDTVLISKLQEEHMANIAKLSKRGKLMVAGPFSDDGEWRGIYIFDCETKEEVEKLLTTDPMIRAGMLAYIIHPWWTGMNSVFR
jgi:uncharacterized protein YciI